ncbi:MAG: hypothetical protein LBN95_13715 [Prevotellaceae bacterium]|jgi:hypothetical protein|nr:hypothetical protein [Prevotellaceae bacterium]
MTLIAPTYRINGQPDTFDMYWQILTGLAPSLNANNLYYYQIKAQQVDGELKVTICDRNNAVLGTFYCPYGCCMIALSVIYPYKYPQVNRVISFNADVQDYYNVDATKGFLSNSTADNAIGVSTIKINTLTGSDDEVVLGEFEYSGYSVDSAPPVFTISFPIPIA